LSLRENEMKAPRDLSTHPYGSIQFDALSALIDSEVDAVLASGKNEAEKQAALDALTSVRARAIAMIKEGHSMSWFVPAQ
jgi:hypothetical protein